MSQLHNIVGAIRDEAVVFEDIPSQERWKSAVMWSGNRDGDVQRHQIPITIHSLQVEVGRYYVRACLGSDTVGCSDRRNGRQSGIGQVSGVPITGM